MDKELIVKETKNISLDSLEVWNDNPRIVTKNSEEDAIVSIFKSDSRGMYNLCKDICDNWLSPANNLLVYFDKKINKYIVIEGNRRISALKCILNPTLLTGHLDEGYIKKLSKLNKSKIIENKNNIMCSIDIKENQINLLKNIHMGEQEGIGRKKWGRYEKSKYNQMLNHAPKINVSTTIVDYIKENADMFSSYFLEIVTNEIAASNIDRLLQASVIKKYLEIKDYSQITTEQLFKICCLLEFFYESGNKVEIIYRIHDMSILLENLKKQDNNIDKIKSENYIYINKPITLKESEAKSDIISNLHKTIDSKNTLIDSHFSEKKIDHITNHQITLETVDEIDKSNKTRRTRSKSPNNFFNNLKWSALNPQSSRENGIIVLCKELHSISKSDLYIKIPNATAIIIRSLLEQILIYYAIKKKDTSTMYTRILKNGENEKFKNLDAILQQYDIDTTKIKDPTSIFYKNPDLARTFSSFSHSGGTKSYFDMCIHNPNYVIATGEILNAIASSGMFAFFNSILNN